MKKIAEDQLLARILGIGAAFTTVFIISGSVTDPVNVPKMLSLGVFSFVAFGLVLSSNLRSRFSETKTAVIVLALFVFFTLASVIAGSSPISQMIYGVYGRNNGLLTYLFLGFVFLSALTLRNHFDYLTRALLIAGSVNVLYCLWVIAFGDFIGWSNPYGNILGTLGNPNFIGSFLGIFFSACFALSLDKHLTSRIRLAAALALPIIAFEIVKSHAIQGRVVAGLGVGIIGFLYIRTGYSRLLLSVYSAGILVVGSLALLGSLQIGPLTSYIYKTSVSLRGQYWLAGWNTGATHPFTGVGMDSFGDWYRRSRDLHALTLPGPNVVVNAAHNVFLDLFAFGGWPLLITYVSLTALSLLSAVKLALRLNAFDSMPAVLLTAWAGYQIQSLISINQIGLAVWGWLLNATLIAYEVSSRSEDQRSPSSQKFDSKSATAQPKLVLVGSLSALVGLLIALPPLISDAKWRSAQIARSVPGIEASMAASYFNPQNTTKFLSNIQALEASGLFELSHKYALQAVAWNPDAFDLWKVLFYIKNSSAEEKSTALSQMKRLDPLNQDVTATQ